MRHGHEHGPVAGRGVHTTSPGRQHPNPEDFFAHYLVQITVSVPHPVFFGKQAWVENMAHRSASSRPLQASESSWSHGSIPPPHELPRGYGDLLVVSLPCGTPPGRTVRNTMARLGQLGRFRCLQARPAPPTRGKGLALKGMQADTVSNT